MKKHKTNKNCNSIKKRLFCSVAYLVSVTRWVKWCEQFAVWLLNAQVVQLRSRFGDTTKWHVIVYTTLDASINCKS